MDSPPVFPPEVWSRTFEIPGEPRAWMRAVPGAGYAREPKEQKANKRFIIAAASKAAPPKPHDGPIFLGASFFFSIPASWSQVRKDLARQGRILPTGTPDLDNLLKLVMDALTKSKRWWRDDCRVAGFKPGPMKLYSDRPGSLIRVAALGAF